MNLQIFIIIILNILSTIEFHKSISNSSRVGQCSFMGIPLHLGNECLKADKLRASGQLLSLGVPKTLKILKI